MKFKFTGKNAKLTEKIKITFILFFLIISFSIIFISFNYIHSKNILISQSRDKAINLAESVSVSVSIPRLSNIRNELILYPQVVIDTGNLLESKRGNSLSNLESQKVFKYDIPAENSNKLKISQDYSGLFKNLKKFSDKINDYESIQIATGKSIYIDHISFQIRLKNFINSIFFGKSKNQISSITSGDIEKIKSESLEQFKLIKRVYLLIETNKTLEPVEIENPLNNGITIQKRYAAIIASDSIPEIAPGKEFDLSGKEFCLKTFSDSIPSISEFEIAAKTESYWVSAPIVRYDKKTIGIILLEVNISGTLDKIKDLKNMAFLLGINSILFSALFILITARLIDKRIESTVNAPFQNPETEKQSNDDEHRILFFRAKRLAIEKNFSEAYLITTELVKQKKDFQEYIKLHGQVAYKLKNYTESAYFLETAFEMNPNSTDLLLGIAKSYLEIGNMSKAAQYIDMHISKYPEDDRAIKLKERINAK